MQYSYKCFRIKQKFMHILLFRNIIGDKIKNIFFLSFLIFQKTLLCFANIGLRTSFINLQVLLINGTK